MAEFSWNIGGGNVTLNYDGELKGSKSLTVTTDANNNCKDREMTLSFEAGYGLSDSVKIKQEGKLDFNYLENEHSFLYGEDNSQYTLELVESETSNWLLENKTADKFTLSHGKDGHLIDSKTGTISVSWSQSRNLKVTATRGSESKEKTIWASCAPLFDINEATHIETATKLYNYGWNESKDSLGGSGWLAYEGIKEPNTNTLHTVSFKVEEGDLVIVATGSGFLGTGTNSRGPVGLAVITDDSILHEPSISTDLDHFNPTDNYIVAGAYGGEMRDGDYFANSSFIIPKSGWLTLCGAVPCNYISGLAVFNIYIKRASSQESE